MMNDESGSSLNTEDVSESNILFDESVLQLMDDPFQSKVDSSKLRTDQNYNGFDSTMGNTWIYPTNYPLRQYQYNISRASLFKNTLVILPTGLGKTFIASVVMYNIYRWYPRGKIIFMAPTRPLVAQQIHACYQVMGFPKDETIELTGRQSKKLRATAWHSKRVFYCTPQVVWSDLNDAEINFPINDIKLIVVDEAHKARGKYAYTEVVQSIWSRNKLFRVLALSATPGRSLQDVSEVIQNLLISNIEVRRETSIDVAPFTFKKSIKTIVVPLDDRLKKIRLGLYNLVEPYVSNLIQQQVIGGHLENLTKAWLLFDRNKFRESTLMNRHPEQSNISSDFSVCISIYHTIELLERHGLRVFLNYFNDENSDINAEEKSNFIMRDHNIKRFIYEIRSESGIAPINNLDISFQANAPSFDLETTIDYGHPKFEILQNCLLDHFKESSDTKAIVFCEYRESVFLINHMLIRNGPLIKPKVFVGQGSSHNRTITQKEQIAIMNDFRMGKCNTLIATCVAEEGIDVGEVDFIICFDVNNKNPIRFIQRIGRTGRKRQGKVAMLVTEGKEQNILRDILATKDGINQKIGKSNEIKSVLYKNCPRLIPPEFNPRCIETFIDIKNTQESPLPLRKKESKSKNNTKKPKNNAIPEKTGTLKAFFKPIEIDDELEENFDLSSYRSDNNDNSTENKNSSLKHMEKINDKNNSCEDESDVQNRINDDDVPLDVKLQKVYSAYITIKKSRAKWNGFGEKLSRKPINNEHLPDAIADFMSKYTKESDEHRVYRTNADLFHKNSDDAKQKLFELMSMLEKHRHLERNKSQPSEHELDNQTEVGDSEFQTNIMNDSQMSFCVNTQHQSKYASQLKPHRIMLADQQIASSTPNKMSSIKQMNMVPLHSPIVANEIIPSSRRNENGEKWYLKFLGLDTAYDLFSDDCDENTRDTKNTSDEQKEICDNLNKSVCGNHSFIDEKEESQYTVSRILKICEDAEKARGDKCDKSSILESTLKRRRLFIGSVDDLFCEDFDDDIVINTQAVDVSLSPADDMLNYDVGDAIAEQKNSQASTSLFKDTIEVASSNKSQNIPIKSLTAVKSDELFSSYNESTTNITKHIPNQVDHVSSQNIQTTPQKSNSTNIFSYHCRSPSVLIKSSSVLSQLGNNQNNFHPTSSDQHSKSSMFGSGILKSDVNLNSRLEDLDEIKENITSPFSTCHTSALRQNTNRQLEFQIDSDCDTEFSGDEIFATCQPISQRKKTSNKVKQKRKLKNKFNFIDDEVAVSGDESSDENFIETQSQLSITDYEEDDPSVDMQAKYLQSIRSPMAGRRYHIPRVVPKVTQSIFSQFVAPDQSRYEEDSFVVGSDEDTDDSHSDETTTVPSRTKKRKSDEIVYPKLKRRRRIIEMSSDSE
ncbi:ATP-dependent DNA helicase fml1 [Contarinia nasturtii]|uniref:ATP-dependent DNA helicase fml1 n=1 Tax=Contarinia nasturtii TaxID=265458 RepID=UPI0012D472E0|nr:ATP-dependent DNA helicase fml1 [Contarinia nasturtii]